jgi:hypothetical protein
VPAVGAVSDKSILTRVVLPARLGPSRPNTCPAGTRKLTSCTARSERRNSPPEYVLLTRSKARAGTASTGGGADRFGAGGGADWPQQGLATARVRHRFSSHPRKDSVCTIAHSSGVDKYSSGTEDSQNPGSPGLTLLRLLRAGVTTPTPFPRWCARKGSEE